MQMWQRLDCSRMGSGRCLLFLKRTPHRWLAETLELALSRKCWLRNLLSVSPVTPRVQHSFTNRDATKLGKQSDMPLAYDADAANDSRLIIDAFLERLK